MRDSAKQPTGAGAGPCALFSLAPPGSAVSFQYQRSQAIHHHRVILTGCLFCSVASRLRLIIANSGACSEGGVSSLSSDPLTGSHAIYQMIESILKLGVVFASPLLWIIISYHLRKVFSLQLRYLLFCFCSCIVI